MNVRAWARAGRMPALVGAVVVVGALATAPLRPHASGSPVPSAERVVVVAVPGLVASDLGTGLLPTLDRLAGEGAVSAVATRTLSSRPSAEEAYLSLSAGTRVAADVDRDGTVTVSSDSPTDPGLLGDELHEAGVSTTVIGPDAAVSALADSDGAVDTVVPPEDYVVYEGGRTRSDPTAIVRLLRPALAEPSVTLIDTGDTTRAARRRDALRLRDQRAREQGAPEVDQPDVDEGELLRRQALTDLEPTLRGVAAEVERAPGTLLAILGLTPTAVAPELSPLVLSGDGVPTGIASSPATDRPGLVTIVDVTPTVLESVGASPSVAMTGRPVVLDPTDDGLAVVERIDEVARSTTQAYGPSITSLFTVQTLALAILSLWLFETRRRPGWNPRWWGGLMGAVLLTLASWPAATFLAGLRPSGLPSPGWSVAVTWGIAAAMGISALALGRRGPPARSLFLVAAATTLVIGIDIVTGARLQASTVLGHTAVAASRFHGVGNAAFGAFAAAALVTAALVVALGRDRRRDVCTAAAILGVVLVLDVAPSLGADFGGVLSFVPASILLLVVLVGRRIRPRVIGFALLAVALGVVAVVGADLLRPAGSRTHIGEFALDVLRDPAELWATITRKWAVNMESLERTTWTRTLPAIAVALAVTLLSPRRRAAFRRTSPTGPAFLAVASLAGLGFLTNDSGLLVLGVAAVWLVPLVVIPSLAADTGILGPPPALAGAAPAPEASPVAGAAGPPPASPPAPTAAPPPDAEADDRPDGEPAGAGGRRGRGAPRP
ncbi:hypothetical protein PO878_17050 [Iamia majanohamensis]|uniref:Uncharacterized protein n=1 Tax=Iamia majanohamensis TaxID=467976 RepID=A0AAE9YC77_9ACTN|nr:hypothetical protein [Iamia majanohamensis]WCO66212.1 hypothetical protein PO878_17050 [Iamia majanohamensis]